MKILKVNCLFFLFFIPTFAAHRCDEFTNFKKNFKSYLNSLGTQNLKNLKSIEISGSLSLRRTKIGKGETASVYSTLF